MLANESKSLGPLTVCLVLKERGWILEKLAARLAEALPEWNVRAQISYVPSSLADINHWMLYFDVEGGWYGKNTLAITHVDRPAKLHVLKRRMKKDAVGICMSRMTLEELVRRGIQRDKLCFITPPHDGRMRPRRIVIGITSRVRPDGAKNEQLLIKLAATMRLDAFHFEIIGGGWDKVLPPLEAAGATFRYFAGTDNGLEDYNINLERVPTFDYYLYLGFNDASLGYLDALAAGVPTIVTPQDFHLDVNGGMTFPFSNLAQLRGIFEKVARERQSRVDSVSAFTWNEYARKHALAWRMLAAERHSGINAVLHAQESFTTPLPVLSLRESLAASFRFYTRGNLASFWADFLLLWEFYTGRKFWETSLYSCARSVKRLVIRR